MASGEGTNRVAQLVLAVAIGIALAALIGFGVRAAYPAPSGNAAELKRLDEQQQALDTSRKLVGQLSGAHRAANKKLEARIAAEKKVAQAGNDGWVRTSSVALLALAALLMGASVLLGSKSPVIANALFAGGLLTAVYTAVWAFMTAADATRFAVPAIAVLLLAAFVFVKLARARRAGGFGTVAVTSEKAEPPAA